MRGISFIFEKTPHMSLTCKLVPVQYREYKYGLLLVIKVTELTNINLTVLTHSDIYVLICMPCSFLCQIADEHKAVLLADMAHISGLVAAQVSMPQE